jgi:hypothetical protein
MHACKGIGWIQNASNKFMRVKRKKRYGKGLRRTKGWYECTLLKDWVKIVP